MNIPTSSQTQCIAAAAAILGDKWTPLLINALSGRPLGFCNLQRSVGTINPRTLSARLSRLEHEHIIYKHIDPTAQDTDGPCHGEYQLTQKGRDLLPILSTMATWSEHYSQ